MWWPQQSLSGGYFRSSGSTGCLLWGICLVLCVWQNVIKIGVLVSYISSWLVIVSIEKCSASKIVTIFVTIWHCFVAASAKALLKKLSWQSLQLGSINKCMCAMRLISILLGSHEHVEFVIFHACVYFFRHAVRTKALWVGTFEIFCSVVCQLKKNNLMKHGESCCVGSDLQGFC